MDRDKHTLTIKDCTLADEGEYTAVAGESRSTAELIISEAPTDFSMQLKDQTISEFQDAEFTCKLTKEKADVKWYRNGRELREGPRFVSDGTRRFLAAMLFDTRPCLLTDTYLKKMERLACCASKSVDQTMSVNTPAESMTSGRGRGSSWTVSSSLDAF